MNNNNWLWNGITTVLFQQARVSVLLWWWSFQISPHCSVLHWLLYNTHSYVSESWLVLLSADCPENWLAPCAISSAHKSPPSPACSPAWPKVLKTGTVVTKTKRTAREKVSNRKQLIMLYLYFSFITFFRSSGRSASGKIILHPL